MNRLDPGFLAPVTPPRKPAPCPPPRPRLTKADEAAQRERLEEIIEQTESWEHLSIHRGESSLSLDCDHCEEGVDLDNPEHHTPEAFADEHADCEQPWEDSPFAEYELSDLCFA